VFFKPQTENQFEQSKDIKTKLAIYKYEIRQDSAHKKKCLIAPW